MSQEEIDPYYQSGESTVEHRDIDRAGSDHPFGDEPKEFQADLRPLIRKVSDSLYDDWTATVREYLANAETACLKVKQYSEDPEASPFDDMIVPPSYQPKVMVTWDQSERKLIIQDNGIGMAGVEVDQVFRRIGRSAARDLGGMSGEFGMGALSFSKFIGDNQTMVMLSHSRLNDDNAAYLVSLAGVEPMIGQLGDDEYGTRFELDQKSEEMDVRDAVKTYAQWMRVPVLYREIGSNGEEVFNEDWGDKRLYDEYEKNTYCESVVYPGAFAAYASHDAEGRTLLLSMEIERNHVDIGDSRYPYDIRILDESGKVVYSDDGNEGLIPVPRTEYKKMLLDARSEYITEDLLRSNDVTAQTVIIDGEKSHLVDEATLDEGRLPMGNYVTEESADEIDEYGPTEVIAGEHKGRTVIDQDEWNDLPEGRAEDFVPKDELSSDDICLPKPSTDRSSLQKNEDFWQYVEQQFAEKYDEDIEQYRQLIESIDSPNKAIEQMETKTVEDIEEVNHAF